MSILRTGLIVMLCTTTLQAQTVDEVTATDYYYDFDADNGLTAYTAGGYQRLWDSSGVGKTYHPTQNGGDLWTVYTSSPYSGGKCFAVDVVPDPSVNENGRSENIICRDITTSDTRYFRYAFRVDDDAAFDGNGGHLWVSQSWQDDGTHMQNLILNISEDEKLEFRLRYGDNSSDGVGYIQIWTSPWDIEVGKWYNILIKYKPFAPGSAGQAALHLMDNATGIWSQLASYSSIPSGIVTPTGNIKFKLGGYLGNDRDWLASYDEIVYGRTWQAVTRNYLVGYQKKILDVGYRDTDSSSRGNNITRHGNAYWDGTWLTLDGNGDYASMNVATSANNGLEDFDVANYLRIDTQFKISAAPNGTAGIIYAGSSDGYGLALDTNLKLYFAIEHADGSSSWFPSGGIQTSLNTTYAVQATYNRFGNITLDVNGQTWSATSVGKPIKEPDAVWIGRRKSYYFNGQIDKVIVYNNHNGGS